MGGGAVLAAGSAEAQVLLTPGEIAILTTGGGGPLVTRVAEPVSGAAIGLPSVFRFQFGYATAEGPTPGGVHDSLTVTLTTTSDTPVAVLVVADVFGLTLAPLTPGGLPVGAGDLGLSLTEIPAGFGAGLTLRAAATVDFAVPGALQGQPLRVYFDLFDNGDGAVSTAFVGIPAVVAVPEPASAAAAVACLLSAWVGWRRFRA